MNRCEENTSTPLVIPGFWLNQTRQNLNEGRKIISCLRLAIWPLTIISATLLFSFLNGCGQRPVPLVTVKGAVTFEGRALEGVDVRFYTEPNPTGTRYVGVTGPRGKYRLQEDVPPGNYRIQVSSGVDPDHSKVGDSLKLFGTVWRKVIPASGEINLDLKSEPQNYSY